MLSFCRKVTKVTILVILHLHLSCHLIGQEAQFYKVNVTVKDKIGEKVEGAEVKITSTSNKNNLAKFDSDRFGVCNFALEKAVWGSVGSEIEITVSFRNGNPKSQLANLGLRNIYEIRLDEEYKRIDGRVLDQENNPIPNVNISYRFGQSGINNTSEPIWTNTLGKFSIIYSKSEINKGNDLRLLFHKEGYEIKSEVTSELNSDLFISLKS